MNKREQLVRFFAQDSGHGGDAPVPQGAKLHTQEIGRYAGWILQPGQVLIDNYRVEGMIGSPGGMGQVFAANDTRLGIRVAIKVPAFNVLLSPSGGDMFLEEARKAAQLRPHQNIVIINACLIDPKFQVAVPDERGQIAVPFIVMEYLGGGDLAQRLMKGPLSFEDAAVWFAKICDGLHYAHTLHFSYEEKQVHGMLHRDLKPQNICFDDRGRLVIVDFGLARLLEEPSTTIAIKGTPTHMAPEQWEPDRGIDARTDIYALGVILYQMITGNLPFQGTMDQLKEAHLFIPPPDPKQVRPDIPQDVAQAILKSMAKNKSDRFDSVVDMALAVEQGFENIERSTIIESPPVEPITPPEESAIYDRDDLEGISIDIPQQEGFRNCAACGEIVTPDIVGEKLYCSNCGVTLPEAHGGDESTRISESGQEACPNCGSTKSPSIVNNVPYCPECGFTLQVKETPQPPIDHDTGSGERCPSCGGTELSHLPGGIYCETCGLKLST